MIASLEGKISFIGNNFIIIEVSGVGYKVFMPENDLKELETNENRKIRTYLRISQDDISLFGFLTNEELTTFELLISVGGIGAKSALNILSNVEPSSFALDVITDNIDNLKKLPGIGAKTAGRIVLELKDKIKTEDAINQNAKFEEKIKLDQKVQDAIDALQVLGYPRYEIQKKLKNIDVQNLTTEEIIKQGLQVLGK